MKGIRRRLGMGKEEGDEGGEGKHGKMRLGSKD
jgi:hypothetical protein